MIVVLHLLGAFLLFSGIGVLALGAEEHRKLGSMTHGIALVVLLVTGLVALMSLDHSGGLPGWIYGKLVIWLLMGGAIAVLRRSPGLRVPLYFLLPLLGTVAAWLALYRPGS